MTDISSMNIKSDKVLLEQIGNFIKQKRIKMDLTQNDLAHKAAISRSTLSLIERGESIALATLVKILRILDALYVLGQFQISEDLSPLQLAKGDKKLRQRASNRSNNQNSEDLGW